jgi:hypothetical protein
LVSLPDVETGPQPKTYISRKAIVQRDIEYSCCWCRNMAKASHMDIKLPSWFRQWYLFNLVVLPFDWLFVVLRPRTLESRGGDLAYLFPIFQVYAKLDTLFDNTDDDLVHYIYFVCQPISLAIIFCLAIRLRRSASVAVALCCIVEGAFTFTKTLLYVLYSWKHIVPSARIPISVMNATWGVVSAWIAYRASIEVSSAFAALQSAPKSK